MAPPVGVGQQPAQDVHTLERARFEGRAIDLEHDAVKRKQADEHEHAVEDALQPVVALLGDRFLLPRVGLAHVFRRRMAGEVVWRIRDAAHGCSENMDETSDVAMRAALSISRMSVLRGSSSGVLSRRSSQNPRMIDS